MFASMTLNNVIYKDKGMLEYNPVKVGQQIKLVVSKEDHSAHRIAKFST